MSRCHIDDPEIGWTNSLIMATMRNSNSDWLEKLNNFLFCLERVEEC